MAIDSSALSNLNTALSSLGVKTNSSNSYASNVARLTEAGAAASTQTRYKSAFEEKLKLANNSEDKVDISEESMNALRNYVNQEKQATENKSPTYDYATLKKQREANYQALQAETAQKYGKQDQSEAVAATDNAAAGTQSTETVTEGAAATDTVAESTGV